PTSSAESTTSLVSLCSSTFSPPASALPLALPPASSAAAPCAAAACSSPPDFAPPLHAASKATHRMIKDSFAPIRPPTLCTVRPPPAVGRACTGSSAPARQTARVQHPTP